MFGRDNTATGFGWVKFKGRIHEEDIIILSNGDVIRRDSDEVLRKYGTMKAVTPNEMNLLVSGNPEIIVIGVGQKEDALRIPPESMEILEKSGARIVQGLSPKAVKYFDNLAGTKAALIHVR